MSPPSLVFASPSPVPVQPAMYPTCGFKRWIADSWMVAVSVGVAVGVGGSVGGGPFMIEGDGETCGPVGEGLATNGGEHAASRRTVTRSGHRMGFTVQYNGGGAH